MKNLSFALKFILAILVVGVATSCGKDDSNQQDPVSSTITKTYTGTIKICLADPSQADPENPNQTIEGQKITATFNKDKSVFALSIANLNINIYPIVATTSIAITDVPYVYFNQNYVVDFVGSKTISFLGTTADVKSITGTITESALPLTVFAVGSALLADVPVTIFIDASVDM